MNAPARLILAALAGLALLFLLNLLGILWLNGTLFETNAFYDGCAAILTLALPALIAGLLVGLLAREQGLNLSALTFALFCLIGFVHHYWRIPPVSAHSVHSGLMHYFLYNPLVALAFGTLGGWFGSLLATGKVTLADPEPVMPAGED
ncbi:MAG: hypothetical protein M3Y13_12870 [Armatimonadota bacterium]|nr:hypothetical protein [Armatimonadota bacterium]